MKKQTQTTCPYCGVGCGVLVNEDEDGDYSVVGDPDHPANEGKLCSKGSALAETLHLKNRLLTPEIGGQKVSWEEALDTVASGFTKIIKEHGPDAVAFYVSGQLLTEDYYVANKLMKGFIGSGNIDTNSRLCMSSPVAAYKRAFGEDCVPVAYEDLERAQLIVIVGSNTAWCHPVIYQRIVKARKNNPSLKIILIDPRKTATADIADLHLPVKPGTDAWLWNGLLAHLKEAEEINLAYVNNFTEGFETTLEEAQQSSPDIESTAEKTGLTKEEVAAFFDLFKAHEKTVTLYSQGVNQSSSGTDKCNAIINAHLATGRIGRPGMGPFSITGQPNAMGGREVGGLSNQLAAHMSIEDESHRDLVQEFWQSPTMPTKDGLKAIDMFDAIDKGKIKAVWIMATNPAVSMPDANKVRAALKKCELSIISDCVGDSDTARLCNIKLPATTWGERDGTVTNSERCISRQKPFVKAPGDAKHDWWIISQVAKRMGFDKAFYYAEPVDVFREHAALSAYKNDGNRLFNIGKFAAVDKAECKNLFPVQWPITESNSQGTTRLFAEGKFSTKSRRAYFIPITPRLPQHKTSPQYPFTLNSGRFRDHWHTMMRTGVSGRLSSHKPEPIVEINVQDAEKLDINSGELTEIISPHGSAVMRAEVTQNQRQGLVFVPMHWNDQFASSARTGTLFDAHCDPVSGQPEFKAGRVKLKKFEAAWSGFILTRKDIANPTIDYWVRRRIQDIWSLELAFKDPPEDFGQFARSILCTPDNANWIDFRDNANSAYRGARFIGDRLDSCIVISPSADLPKREWMTALFESEKVSKEERSQILSGFAPKNTFERGAIVCSCFSVGENQIVEAIRDKKLTSVEEISHALEAGTNCGSCLPELKALLEDVLADASD